MVGAFFLFCPKEAFRAGARYCINPSFNLQLCQLQFEVIEIKEKRVLISVLSFCGFSGSELHTLEMARQFTKHGFKVTICTLKRAYPMMGYAKAEKIDVIETFAPYTLSNHYEIFLAQHYVIANKLIIENDFTFSKLICSSLSPFEPLEALPSFYEEADLLTFVSQETCDFRIRQVFPDHPKNTFLFLNYANSSFFEFSLDRKLPTNPKKVAIVSNHTCQELKEFTSIAEAQNLEVSWLGAGESFQHSVAITAELLSTYDAVITIGKTVQYCFALGIPVYCYDYLGGPGYISDSNFEKGMYFNFSGRCCNKKKTGAQIFDDIIGNYTEATKRVDHFKNKANELFRLESLFQQMLDELYSIPTNKKSLFGYYDDLQKDYVLALARETIFARSSAYSHSTVYFDLDHGFTEEPFLTIPFSYNTEVVAHFMVPKNTTFIRFDPSEDLCICAINEILLAEKKLDSFAPITKFEKFLAPNAEVMDVFIEEDPQYLVTFEANEQPVQMTIRYKVFPFNSKNAASFFLFQENTSTAKKKEHGIIQKTISHFAKRSASRNS